MNKGGIKGSVDMLVVGSGVDVFLMRRVEAPPRYSVVAASDVADRGLCGNRIFRRDFPDAATIGMRSLIDSMLLGAVVTPRLGACI